jgi:hypothetical protein
VTGIRSRLTGIADDLDRWEAVSTSTDRDEA